MSFLQLASDLATGAKASGHVKMPGACAQASRVLAALQELNTKDDNSIDGKRMDAMEADLIRKRDELNVHSSKERGGAREHLGEIVKSLTEDLEKVDLEDESQMVAFM